MEKSSSPPLTPTKLNPALWSLIALEGVAALTGLLRVPSEPGSSLFLGFSLPRLIIATVTLFGVLLFAAFALAALRQPVWLRRLAAAVPRFLAGPRRQGGLYIALFTAFFGLAAFLVLTLALAAQDFAFYKTLLTRAGPLLVWAVLIPPQLGLLVRLNSHEDRPPFLSSPLNAGILLAVATVIYVLALKVYTTTTWDLRMRRLEEFIFLPAAVLLAWGLLHSLYRSRPWYERLDRILLLASIGVITYTIYRHTGQWMDWQLTPSKAYWDLLADAFLHGRLYVENPGEYHDLTLYNGHWYVPNPPLPALVLMPLVGMFGLQNFNTVLFSVVCGAVNAVLIYMTLEKASQVGMIPTGRSGNLWLTVIFALGTNHWWLSLLGRMWYLSQLLTLTFATLAVLLALKKASPWLAGFCLGLAILSRPNVFTIWPFLAGIYLYLDHRENGTIRWMRFFGWAVQSAVPVFLSVGGLLIYNYLRFGDYFDFGYVTINGAVQFVEAVRTYGMFNVHFLPANLKVMFLNVPTIGLRSGCLSYSADSAGYNILVMSPVIVYIFRRFIKSWWMIGAWASVLLSAGLLLLYHNTGSAQIGYRYLMDFIQPVVLLMALGGGSRPSWTFKALTLLSIISNAAGILWWFNRWWC